MREQFKPRQISPTELRMWENLVSSQYQLKISTLGRKWRFRFLLGTLPIPKSAVIATICLGDCFGIIQCKLLPARWLREILRGPSVETLVEPFRSAVVAVLLQDFFSKLSEVSQLPIRLIESPPPLVERALFM